MDVTFNQLFGYSFNYLVSIVMITIFELVPIIFCLLKHYIPNFENIMDSLAYYN